MLSIRKPSTNRVRAFLIAQSKYALTYTDVGATLTLPPAGYIVDHTRIKLGEGEKVFAKAKLSLERWDQFKLGWVDVWSPQSPIHPGEFVAVIARQFGLWWVNACRVVAVVDEHGPLHRFGFAYGTLPDHAGTGEERFLVEYDERTGEVWFDILAFSKPHQFLTKVGYWFMRRAQKRFGRESSSAMVRSVEAGSPVEAPRE